MSSLAGREALIRSGFVFPALPGDRERTVLVLRSCEPVPASLLQSVNVCPVLLCVGYIIVHVFVLLFSIAQLQSRWPMAMLDIPHSGGELAGVSRIVRFECEE